MAYSDVSYTCTGCRRSEFCDCCNTTGGTVEGLPHPHDVLRSLAYSSNHRQYGWFSVDNIKENLPGYITVASTQRIINPPIIAPSGVIMYVDPTQVLITINVSMSSPFNAPATTDYDRAGTILHELGHLYHHLWGPGASSIVSDHDDSARSAANHKLIRENCLK